MPDIKIKGNIAARAAANRALREAQAAQELVNSDVVTINNRIDALANRITTLENNYTALAARIKKLEDSK